MAKAKSRRKFRKDWEPDAHLSRRLRSYFMIGSTLMGSSATGVAQQPPSFETIPSGYTVYPINYTFPETAQGASTAVDQQYDVVLGDAQTVAFKFFTFYASEFNPVQSLTYKTLQVWIAPVEKISATVYTKSWEGNRMVSHACNSAIVEGSPSGPGIRGNHGWNWTGVRNYLNFFRHVHESICSAGGSCKPRDMIYSAGHWEGSSGAGGAIPIFIESGVLSGSTYYGWINVSLNRQSTALTISQLVLAPANGPAQISDTSNCSPHPATLTGSPLRKGQSDSDSQPAAEVGPPMASDILSVPLPDGSVPLTLGLLATGEQGVSLWRHAEALKRMPK